MFSFVYLFLCSLPRERKETEVWAFSTIEFEQWQGHYVGIISALSLLVPSPSKSKLSMLKGVKWPRPLISHRDNMRK